MDDIVQYSILGIIIVWMGADLALGDPISALIVGGTFVLGRGLTALVNRLI